MAFLLCELDAHEARDLVRVTHPLLGHASLHASLIEGGTAMTTYPDRCVLRIERRTLPGETPEGALGQVEAACAALKAQHPSFSATVVLDASRAPSDVSPDAPVVRSLLASTAATGRTASIDGATYWSDAALFNGAGIPAVCYGPGDIGLAHGAVEWVPIDEIERATVVLEHFLGEWTRA
jgi:acetylornithine deacetylase